MPDPSLCGYVLKDMFVPNWLPKVSTFNAAEGLQTCKCKTVYQLISYFSGINFCIISSDKYKNN